MDREIKPETCTDRRIVQDRIQHHTRKIDLTTKEINERDITD